MMRGVQLLLLLASGPNLAIVPALAQEIGGPCICEHRRDARGPVHQGRTCFLRNARRGVFGAPIALETVHVEAERLRERPEVRRVLAPLVGQEPSGKRPERILEVCGFDGMRGAARRFSAGAHHEVAQVDPHARGREPVEGQRAVGTREVGVDHHERGRRWSIDARRRDLHRRRGRTSIVRLHDLSRTHELEGTPDEVFPFFADAFNLESITPPLLQFGVVTPAPILLGTGTVIQYAMKLHGIPINWTSSIQRWDPPHAFVDTQIRGPYRLWHHTHTFEALPGERTLMRDDVRYALPFQPFGELAMPLVRRDLARIFDYRGAVIADRLAAARSAALARADRDGLVLDRTVGEAEPDLHLHALQGRLPAHAGGAPHRPRLELQLKRPCGLRAWREDHRP